MHFDGEGRDKVVVGIDSREQLPAVLNTNKPERDPTFFRAQ
jgi:hypothetical protein